ncbi:hypothetical protein A0H76_1218 [Hepatospora eriocheir]|uniref:Uncharacterized protein n=1 Tax=Hepatospora eriocheir TaxID=1081669 RepID=A0A1X0QHR8_9MICR|nr:hypothetical protein A0H76_1218 [Hepatospora eriocheir]
MTIFNLFKNQRILNKDEICDFDLLNELNLLKKVGDERYELNECLEQSELQYLIHKNKQLKNKLQIYSVEESYKNYMEKLHEYNEIKDVLQSMIGKISELKGVTIKKINKELEVNFDE